MVSRLIMQSPIKSAVLAFLLKGLVHVLLPYVTVMVIDSFTMDDSVAIITEPCCRHSATKHPALQDILATFGNVYVCFVLVQCVSGPMITLITTFPRIMR